MVEVAEEKEEEEEDMGEDRRQDGRVSEAEAGEIMI